MGQMKHLPEWTIAGTLLCPSHVLLTALTVTEYCSPHCKVVIIQVASSVVQ